MHHERHAFNNVQSLKFDLATGWLQALYTIMSPISHLFNKQISSLAQKTDFFFPVGMLKLNIPKSIKIVTWHSYFLDSLNKINYIRLQCCTSTVDDIMQHDMLHSENSPMFQESEIVFCYGSRELLTFSTLMKTFSTLKQNHENTLYLLAQTKFIFWHEYATPTETDTFRKSWSLTKTGTSIKADHPAPFSLCHFI